MSDMVCDNCGLSGDVAMREVNQKRTRRLCRACIVDDAEKRSLAATGRAGRRNKGPDELENVLCKFYLNREQSLKLEAFLREEGYDGSRGAALKAFLKDFAAHIRWKLGGVSIVD